MYNLHESHVVIRFTVRWFWWWTWRKWWSWLCPDKCRQRLWLHIQSCSLWQSWRLW